MCSHWEEGFGGNRRVEEVDDLVFFGPLALNLLSAALQE